MAIAIYPAYPAYGHFGHFGHFFLQLFILKNKNINIYKSIKKIVRLVLFVRFYLLRENKYILRKCGKIYLREK